VKVNKIRVERLPKVEFPASSWRWPSDKDFDENVHPFTLGGTRHVHFSHRSMSVAQCAREIFLAVDRLVESLKNLKAIIAGGKSAIDFSVAIGIALEICCDGERLLLHQSRLGQSMGAYGFLHGKDAFERDGKTGRDAANFHALRQLAKDTDVLLTAFYSMQEEGSEFLVPDLKMPPDLAMDFYLARDCFSVGLDDIGLLVAGRGLEGIVRRIIRDRRVQLQIKNSSGLASEADFADVVEVARRLRWRKDETRLFSSDTIQLLHWQRDIRNAGAHPGSRRQSKESRTVARAVLELCDHLWKIHTSNTRAQLKDLLIIKAW
jgi:hypothetical protein